MSNLIASGGVAVPNRWKLLFGEASRGIVRPENPKVKRNLDLFPKRNRRVRVPEGHFVRKSKSRVETILAKRNGAVSMKTSSMVLGLLGTAVGDQTRRRTRFFTNYESFGFFATYFNLNGSSQSLRAKRRRRTSVASEVRPLFTELQR